MESQTVEPPETEVSRRWLESPMILHPMALTALLQPHGSGYSREFVRESVLAWAALTWPDLFVGRNACEPTFESHSDRSCVKVTCTHKRSYAWSFRGIRADVSGGRLWETRVLVLGSEEHDLLGISAGYRGEIEPAAPVAQPAFLIRLVEHLPFLDGGYSVVTVPRRIFDERALVRLQDHVLDQRRELPILIVGSRPPGSDSAEQREPRRIEWQSMARDLCGVAHVVSIGPLIVPMEALRVAPPSPRKTRQLASRSQ